MALGKSYDNNQGDGNYSPRTTSPFKWFNGESSIDATALTVSYWRGLLRIGIAPKKGEEVGDTESKYDYKNDVACHLNHTSARILAEEIKNFIKHWTKKDMENYHGGGVATSKSWCTISNANEFSGDTPCLAIHLFGEDGKSIVSSACYEFKTNFHYALRNLDPEKMTYDTAPYELIELIEFLELIENYNKSANGAIAHSVYDRTYKDLNDISTKLSAIMKSLGISESGGRKPSGYNSQSAFKKPAQPGAVETVEYDSLTDLE